MEAWDKTWKMHRLPMWAKKALRLRAITKGVWVPASRLGHTRPEDFIPRELLDHWGSVNRHGHGFHYLVMQPYGNYDEIAVKFAEEMGWAVSVFAPGPWSEGVRCYKFWPRTLQLDHVSP